MIHTNYASKLRGFPFTLRTNTVVHLWLTLDVMSNKSNNNILDFFFLAYLTPLQEESLFPNSPSHSILRCLLPSNAPVCT